MAFVTIEDSTADAELIIFPKLFAQLESQLQTHTPLLVTGTVDPAASKCKIKAQTIMLLDQLVTGQGIAQLAITLPDQTDPAELLTALRAQLATGATQLKINFRDGTSQFKLIRPR